MNTMTNESQTNTHSIEQCPTNELLRDYFVGLTDEFTSSKIDQHLQSCSKCNTALSSMETYESSLLETSIQESVLPSDLAEDSIVHNAISEAKKRQPAVPLPNIPSMGLEHPTNIGPYRIYESIGRGGMARVYRAEHRTLKRIVALKLLPVHYSDSHSIERFEREVLAAGKLQHPSIVTATDAGIEAGVQYLAMEFIDGLDLGKVTRRLPSIPVADVCEIGKQVALGLVHAHGLGMVHRDIKPSNIMLNAQGQVKLLDFGLVLLDRWDGPANELTTVGQFLGTLDYMAPEQAERSATVDHRSDLYSLGATMYRLLTGQTPLAMLPQQSPIEKIRILANHTPVHIKTHRPDLPNGLSEIIMRLLETRPENRFPSAAHVAEALAPFCDSSNLKLLVAQALKSQDALELPSPRNAVGESAHRTAPRLARKRFWPVVGLTILALLPFGAYFGIKLVLESDQGNLVIESELDNIQVDVKRKDGKANRTLEVRNGTKVTTLYSGDYDITINMPIDGVSVQPNSVTLKKGETLIARVVRLGGQVPSQLESSANVATGNAVPLLVGPFIQSLAKKYPVRVYKGESIESLILTLDREQDFGTWLASLEAISRFLSPEDKVAFLTEAIEVGLRKGFLAQPNQLRNLFQTTHVTVIQLDYLIGELLKGESIKEKTSPSITFDILDCIHQYDVSGNRPGGDAFKLDLFWSQMEKRFVGPDAYRELLMFEKNLQEIQQRYSTMNAVVPSDFSEKYPWCAFLYGGESKPENLVALIENTRDDFNKFQFVVTRLSYNLNNPKYKPVGLAIQSRIEMYLDRWMTSKEVLGGLGNVYMVGQNTLLGFDIGGYTASIGGMGGMGMGIGGMGGGMGGWNTIAPLPDFSVPPKQPIAIALMRMVNQMPTDYCPKAKLKELRNKIEVGNGKELAESLFEQRWQRIRLNEEGVFVVQKDHSNPFALKQDEMDVVAFGIRRWIDAIVDSDLRSSSDVIQLFGRSLRDATMPKESLRWIVQRGRSEINLEQLCVALPKPIDALDFQIEYVDLIGETCIARGRYGNGAPRVAPGGYDFQFELEFEPEGWRIRKFVRFSGNEEAVAFDIK